MSNRDDVGEMPHATQPATDDWRPAARSSTRMEREKSRLQKRRTNRHVIVFMFLSDFCGGLNTLEERLIKNQTL
jgi:hypothetical protein